MASDLSASDLVEEGGAVFWRARDGTTGAALERTVDVARESGGALGAVRFGGGATVGGGLRFPTDGGGGTVLCTLSRRLRSYETPLRATVPSLAFVAFQEASCSLRVASLAAEEDASRSCVLVAARLLAVEEVGILFKYFHFHEGRGG